MNQNMGDGDYEACKKMYKYLVGILHKQHSLIEALIMERDDLQERMAVQRNQWRKDIMYLKAQILDSERQSEIARELFEAKSDLIIAINQSAFVREMISEVCADHLEHLKKALRFYKLQLKEQSSRKTDAEQNADESWKVKGRCNCKNWEDHCNITKGNPTINELTTQVKKLKSDHTKLSNTKQSEYEIADGNIVELQQSANNWKSSVRRKDGIIEVLKGDILMPQKTLESQTKEVSALTKDSKNCQDDSPMLMVGQIPLCPSSCNLISKHAKSPSRCHGSRRKATNTDELKSEGTAKKQKHVPDRTKASSASQPKEKKLQSSSKAGKRSSIDSPRLFSSNFKVPRLKKPVAII